MRIVITFHSRALVQDIRERLQEHGAKIDIVTSPEQLGQRCKPDALILTGEQGPREGEKWAEAASTMSREVQVITILEGHDPIARGRSNRRGVVSTAEKASRTQVLA